MMDFNQYVRILVDTDVDTHFIVSLPRVSTVVKLRELIKVTHKDCYPERGDVGIGKLEVRGGDHGYHLPDYLCIGQVYNTSEGKVKAEVQLPSLCAFGNDQKYLQSGPNELSTSSGLKKIQLLATDNGNYNNEGQLSVEPQSGEKATNHSIWPSIPQLLEGSILAEDQSRIAAALEGNGTVNEGTFVCSTVECLDREKKSPATQAPFIQAPQELMEISKGFESEKDARYLQKPSSQLVMEETQLDTGVAATGLLRKKKIKDKVKKRTDSLTQVEQQSEFVVQETDDVLVRAGSQKREGFHSHTIAKLQKKTEVTPASSIFMDEDGTDSFVKAQGKNELHIGNLELKNDNDASESTMHFSAGPKQKTNLSPAGSVSITTIHSKVKEKRKKKRKLDEAEVKTMQESTLEGTSAVREVEPDTLVGGNDSVAPSGEKLKKKRRTKKFVDPEASCVDEKQVIGGEKVRELSADRQSELEKAQKGHISGKRKVKVSKLHRSPTSGSLDAEAATNLQFRTSDATDNNYMNVHMEGKDAADLRTVRKTGRSKQSMTDALGANGMASMILGVPEFGTVQAEGETAGEIVESISQARIAHALKERSREDGDKVSGGQQGGKEGEVMLTNDGSNVKDGGAGSDNREVVILVGLPQAKAEASFEQAKDGLLQALDSLQGSPWASGPVLGTKEGRGAPSGTLTYENSFDMMEEGAAARRENGFRNKQHRSRELDNEVESLEREEAGQADVLILPFATQADEEDDGLMLHHERTLQNSKKFCKGTHSSKSAEGSGNRSDSALVRKTWVRVLEHPGEAREPRVSHTNFTVGNGKAFQKQKVTITEDSSVERGEDNREKDSAHALSQDTSYKVAVTQVNNALSGSTTEEMGEEIGLMWSKGTETVPHEQKVEALPSQLKDFIGLSDSAGENVNPDSILSAPAPSKAVRTPYPIVPWIQASGCAENNRQWSLGAAAEIESKFAQFIDSQDGLDEIMDITFSQRKVRSADLVSQVASAGTIELPGAASSRPGNGVLENGGGTMPSLSGVPFTLEKHKSAALLQVPGKSVGGLQTLEFKVPNAVLPSTTAGAENANHNSGKPTGWSIKSMLSSDVEVPMGFGSSPILLKEVQENSGENHRAFTAALQNVDADVTGSESLQPDLKNQSTYALQGTIEANRKKRSEAIVEKRRRVSKRKEDGLEFMVVNNTEQLVRDEMERKDGSEKRVDVETPATVHEFSGQRVDDDSKTNLWRTSKEDRREEENQSLDISLVLSRKSGKKRRQSKVKREEIEVGLKESGLRVNNAVSTLDRANSEEEVKPVFCQEKMTVGVRVANPQNVISEETSMDRSARETEELYLLMEKEKRDSWVQTHRNTKQGVCMSLSLLSGGCFPAGESEIEVDKGEEAVKDTQENIAGTRANEDVDKAGCNVGKESTNLESQADPKVAVRLTNSHLSATNSRGNEGLGHVIQGSDSMEMSDDGLKTREHGNVEWEKGQCEQVEGQTLLQQEKVTSFEFDSEDGDTLVPRIVKSGNKSGKRQAEHIEELCERAVSRVLEDEMLHVADPDLVLQKTSRKDANPTSWISKMKAAVLHCGIADSNVPETKEGAKMEVIQLTVPAKKASKSSKSGDTSLKKTVVHKPATELGSEVCPNGCGKTYRAKASAWYVHKRQCLGAPAD